MNLETSYNPAWEEDVILLEEIEKEKVLVLHNDDYNTFDWVIQSLVEVCSHSAEQAEQCALIVHYKGKCEVKHGPESMIKRMYKTFLNRGLTATIEPVLH